MSILESATAMTFVVVTDRVRAKAFYGETLGFSLIHEDDFAAVFDLNGIALRVSEARGSFTPAQHTVLGWQVADIVASVQALRAAGVSFTIYEGFGQDALGIWTAPGSTNRVAWFRDPDGNVLSLMQP